MILSVAPPLLVTATGVPPWAGTFHPFPFEYTYTHRPSRDQPAIPVSTVSRGYGPRRAAFRRNNVNSDLPPYVEWNAIHWPSGDQ